MRLGLVLLLLLHGLGHGLGYARAAGVVGPPDGAVALSPAHSTAWCAAAVLLVVAAAWVFVPLRGWWAMVAVAALASQGVLTTEWGDARYGSLVNVVALLASAWGLASEGRSSLRSRFERGVAAAPPVPAELPPVTEADLARLPQPVRAYLRRSGCVGQPRVHSFHVRFAGRIRGGPQDRWMPFVAEQVSVLDPPVRLFFLEARRSGVPVHVLHRFANGAASMQVKLLAAIPLADASGPELTAAETVTLFNDLCVFAPAGLIDRRIGWEPIDEHAARAHFAIGPHHVRATLRFNEAGDLVDFVSDDRARASADGATFTRMRWSTPLSAWRAFGARRVATHGEAVWHAPEGTYTYGEFEIVDLQVNGGR